LPDDWPHWTEVEPLAHVAAEHLGLARYFDQVTLVVDDIAADDHPWIEFPGSRAVELYCHPNQFMSVPSISVTTLPATFPWELKGVRVDESDDGEFSRSGTSRFLHHQGLALVDLASGLVRPAEVPPLLAEGYQEIWGVSLDGRLRGRSMPGHPVADRRRRFFRTFSTGGLLLPQHWEIFHAAWDDPQPDHGILLQWAMDLPRKIGTAEAQLGAKSKIDLRSE